MADPRGGYVLGQGGITYPLAFREEQLGREDLSSDEGEPTPSTPSSGDDVARALATGIAHNFDRAVVHSDASSSPGDVTNPNNQPRREIIDVSPEYSNRQSSAAPAPAPDPGGRRPAWPKSVVAALVEAAPAAGVAPVVVEPEAAAVAAALRVAATTQSPCAADFS